jgi:hypothetical protein
MEVIQLFQVARRVEAKVRQERPGRDKVARRAGLQRARFGSDEAGSAQIIGKVARNLPVQKLDSSARVIGWK